MIAKLPIYIFCLCVCSCFAIFSCCCCLSQFSCGQGGCGACTVNIRPWTDPASKFVAAYGCLWPLAAVHKMDVSRQSVASFPGLPRFLFFGFIQYNTRKRKSARNVEGLGIPITQMTSGGREVDVRGGVAHQPTHVQ